MSAGRAPRLGPSADLGAARSALAAAIFRSRRRWIDEPIPIASRYLTTVRRATSKPRCFSSAAIASSLRISVSASITSLIAALTASAAAPPSPSADATPDPKKYLSS